MDSEVRLQEKKSGLLAETVLRSDLYSLSVSLIKIRPAESVFGSDQSKLNPSPQMPLKNRPADMEL